MDSADAPSSMRASKTRRSVRAPSRSACSSMLLVHSSSPCSRAITSFAARITASGVLISWLASVMKRFCFSCPSTIGRTASREKPTTSRNTKVHPSALTPALTARNEWKLSSSRVQSRKMYKGSCDVAFGSRLLPASRVTRCAKRGFISRTYNLLLQRYLGVRFHDAQCGFKAISAEASATLLPLIEDDEWFFDTELLVKAERLNVAMNEVAVTWREDPGSTVHIVDTVRKDLQGMRRLKQEERPGSGLKGQGGFDRTVIHGD